MLIERATHPAYPEWAKAKTSSLPQRWAGRLFRSWERKRNDFAPVVLGAEGDAIRSAARELVDMVERLQSVRVPLDASDSDICERAEVLANYCLELGNVFTGWRLRESVERVCNANGVQAPYIKGVSTGESEVRRCQCAQWWRRQLRKAHAKAVEGGAIALGYVNKARDIYVSNESLQRRIQQNRRNAAALENTLATNENGDEYTLAELAEKSTSNKAIRRGELMTRIAGFERYAVAEGHVGLFFTITCPSRMHKWRTTGGKLVENKKYDGTNPREAQAYLSKTWARIRSALKRRGFHWYGFRIAEPNHDGTPHWHVLVFFDPKWQGNIKRSALPRVCAIVRRYALADSGQEQGAKRRRCDFKPMDASKGTAAGYIAKYVAKNIDGYAVGKDLFGNDAFESSARVEAWAATWGIRQFQQIGGAPVSVWREMRRVKVMPEDAPESMKLAFDAVNKTENEDGTFAAAAWDRYLKAQGGATVGRDYAIKLELEETGEVGRYGEVVAAKPVGVNTWGFVVRSLRYLWQIVRKVVDKKGGLARPWTRVNNCTQGGNDGWGGIREKGACAGQSIWVFHQGGHEKLSFGLGAVP